MIICRFSSHIQVGFLEFFQRVIKRSIFSDKAFLDRYKRTLFLALLLMVVDLSLEPSLGKKSHLTRYSIFFLFQTGCEPVPGAYINGSIFDTYSCISVLRALSLYTCWLSNTYSCNYSSHPSAFRHLYTSFGWAFTELFTKIYLTFYNLL